MSDIDQLYKLMGRGWNINIECKGKGRNYEMTFEAIANKVITEEMTKEEIVYCCMDSYIHTTGNTFNEIVENLIRETNKKEIKK